MFADPRIDGRSIGTRTILVFASLGVLALLGWWAYLFVATAVSNLVTAAGAVLADIFIYLAWMSTVAFALSRSCWWMAGGVLDAVDLVAVFEFGRWLLELLWGPI